MSSSLTKYGMVPMVMYSLDKVLCHPKQYVILGWRKSGLLPFNPEAIDWSTLTPSKKFRDSFATCLLYPGREEAASSPGLTAEPGWETEEEEQEQELMFEEEQQEWETWLQQAGDDDLTMEQPPVSYSESSEREPESYLSKQCTVSLVHALEGDRPIRPKDKVRHIYVLLLLLLLLFLLRLLLLLQVTSLAWSPPVLDLISSLKITAATPLQSQLWPNLLRRRSVMVVAEAGQDSVLGWLLPLVSHLSEGGSHSPDLAGPRPQALVLCSEVATATNVEQELREWVDRAGLQLRVALGVPRLAPSLEVEVVVTTVAGVRAWAESFEQPDAFLERCNTLVLEQADVLAEQSLEQVSNLVTALLEVRGRGSNLQLVAVASKWCPALSTLCTQSLVQFHKPTLVITDMLEAAVYGELSAFCKQTQTPLEKEEQLLAVVAGQEGGLVISCRDVETGERLATLLSAHSPRLVQTGSPEEIQEWDRQSTAPLLVPDSSLAKLCTKPGAKTLVMWDLPGEFEVAQRLSLVASSLKNLLQPAVVVDATVVWILVSPEDEAILAILTPWLQRCGARMLPCQQEESTETAGSLGGVQVGSFRHAIVLSSGWLVSQQLCLEHKSSGRDSQRRGNFSLEPEPGRKAGSIPEILPCDSQ